MFRAVPGNPLYGYGLLLPQLGMPFQKKTTRLREVRGIYFSDGVFTGRESHTSHESNETLERNRRHYYYLYFIYFSFKQQGESSKH